MRLYATQHHCEPLTTEQAAQLEPGTILYNISRASGAVRIKVTEPPSIRGERIKVPYEGGWLTNRDFETRTWVKGV